MGNEQNVRGVVVEAMPNLLYRVQLSNEVECVCYLAGKMKLNKIKVLVGDSVDVILDPYRGKATNRIVYRYGTN